MINKRNKVRTFEGMRYRQVQRKNSRNKKLLPKQQQKYLKTEGYRNLGWDNVIALFKKISELQQAENIKFLSLEELFLEADRIGNKYLDSNEINQRNLAITKELDQIADLMEQQFPDHQVEVIDYTQTVKGRRKI